LRRWKLKARLGYISENLSQNKTNKETITKPLRKKLNCQLGTEKRKIYE
jgi:hypothetical protein